MAISPALSRRQWLEQAGAFGIGAAAVGTGFSAEPPTPQAALSDHEVLEAAPWAKRYGLGCVAFQNRLWVLGGTGTLHNGTQMNDVWSSGDGVQWRQELRSAPWSPRWSHAVFAFAGKLWLIGGLASVEPIRNLNDIWSSPDGRRWTCELADAPWPARHVWATTIHRERMYILGGASDGSHYYQDVISSNDGIHWRIEPCKGPWFEKRKTSAAASYEGKIFLAGGSTLEPSPHLLNDVWSSADGRAWSLLMAHAPWAPRCCHFLFVYRQKLWMVGGDFGAAHYGTDLWSTKTGKDWKLETSHYAWPPRHANGIAVFRDKVWILGGTSDSWGRSSRNDVWTLELTTPRL